MDEVDDVVAVVLAGGGIDRLAAEAGVAFRALVPVSGKPLGSYVLDALAASRRVSRVVLVGAEALPGAADVRLPAGERLVDSVALGCGAAIGLSARRLLLLSADLPWLSGQVVDRWLDQVPAADLVYPAIPRQAAMASFPGQRRTFVRLKSGAYTGGNLFLVASAAVPGLLPWIERAYRARKDPLSLARLIGVGTLVRLLLGRATLEGLAQRVGRLTGLEVRVEVTPEAAIGADVDRPEHLRAVPLPSTRESI